MGNNKSFVDLVMYYHYLYYLKVPSYSVDVQIAMCKGRVLVLNGLS